jgi:glycosyltransferase involved in cell wall biosynthesis
MYCDVPVIVSDSSSMPEVGGPAALLVDPASPEDIATKMMQLYKDESLRNKLIMAARIHREQFTWDLAAQKLWESLMKCVP